MSHLELGDGEGYKPLLLLGLGQGVMPWPFVHVQGCEVRRVYRDRFQRDGVEP